MFFQPELILPIFRGKRGSCVASAVLDCIRLTRNSRSREANSLFIATFKPFGAGGPQTIGHLIISLLNKAGISMNQFMPHSIRYTIVSITHQKGVDIDTIKHIADY